MVLAAAYLAAFIAAISIPGEGTGINVLIVWALIVSSILLAAKTHGRSERVLVLLTLLPVSMVVVRSAGWVLGMEFIVAFLVAAVGASGSSAWCTMLRSGLEIFTRLPRGLACLMAPIRRWVSERSTSNPRRALRSVGLIGSLLLAFGGLFLSADAAFAAIAEEWLVPNIGVCTAAVRVAIFFGTLALAGAFVTYSPASDGDIWLAPARPQGERRFLDGGDWKAGLIALNLLFAAFVVVQITVLFGGRSHVLTTSGLTYAQYARQGFFQLVAVAMLTLVVVAVVVYHCRTKRDRRWAQALLGILCVLTLVILLSASKRMDLYQATYGATRLRLTVDFIIWWLAAIFGLVMAGGARWRGDWLPRAAVVVSLLAVVGFGVSNPDARIAEANVERFLETGEIDLSYLRGLSTDAVPALLELPEPERSCALAPIVPEESSSIWSFNLSRAAAAEIEAPVDDSACLQQTEPYEPLGGRD